VQNETTPKVDGLVPNVDGLVPASSTPGSVSFNTVKYDHSIKSQLASRNSL